MASFFIQKKIAMKNEENHNSRHTEQNGALNQLGTLQL